MIKTMMAALVAAAIGATTAFAEDAAEGTPSDEFIRSLDAVPGPDDETACVRINGAAYRLVRADKVAELHAAAVENRGGVVAVDDGNCEASDA